VANLLDSITPIIPIITDVSVDASGKSIISWIPSPGADMYIIYLQGMQGDVTIDTVWGELSDSYIYDASLANQHYETFSIRALDSCANTKNTTPYHNSIYLEADLDACTHNLTLNWNEYINWDANVSYYSLVVEETDLSNFTTVMDTNLQDITNYVIFNLKDKFSYRIYIVANDGDTVFSAMSNQLVLVPNLPKKPDFNYIEYASINHDNGFVEINCLVDNTAIIDHYDVMRSLREDNNFIKIGEVSFLGTTTIHYTDEKAKTSENFYQYHIYPVDTCGIRLSSPPINMAEYLNDTSFAQTILLETVINLDYSDQGLYPDEYTNTLDFNDYDKWLGDVSEYRLYRSINRQPFNLLPIYTWDRVNDPNAPLQFIDVVTEYGDGNGRFCYYIEAIEGNTTPYGPVLEGSFSNVSCVSQTPIIFIPSVFTPNGDEHNEVFHPVTYYVSEKGYSFTIYSRSGEEIFTTSNPLKGWDGTFNGNIAQDGNYVYHLQYINGVGDLTEKTDMITLVR
jgi:gliding motility-associated-like protein